MARRPAQYGTAKVKERDAGRPLLVILILVAAGIAVFLWLQPESSTTPVATAPEEPEPAAVARETESETLRDRGPTVEEWWSRVEGPIYDAFRAGEEGDCAGLEWAAEDLAEYDTRSEPTLSAAYSGLVSTMERAARTCEAEPGNLDGAMTSAARRLETLVEAGQAYEVEASSLLRDYL